MREQQYTSRNMESLGYEQPAFAFTSNLGKVQRQCALGPAEGEAAPHILEPLLVLLSVPYIAKLQKVMSMYDLHLASIPAQYAPSGSRDLHKRFVFILLI